MDNFVEFNTGTKFDHKMAFNVSHIVHVADLDSGHASIKLIDGTLHTVDQSFEGALIKIKSARGHGD